MFETSKFILQGQITFYDKAESPISCTKNYIPQNPVSLKTFPHRCSVLSVLRITVKLSEMKNRNLS